MLSTQGVVNALAGQPVNERAPGVASLTKSLLTAAPVPVDDVKLVVETFTVEDTPLAVSRALLDTLAAVLPSVEPDAHKTIAHHAIERIAQRVSFEDQLVVLLQNVASVYEKQEQWVEAAKLLARMPLDSGNRSYSADQKADVHIHIAQLYLEDRDPVNAETFINRAAVPIAQCNQPSVHLRYKVCYARILDSKRKFIEAAQWYYRLSQTEKQSDLQVDDEELVTALSHSITCAILAPAGPVRSRLLMTLYKDERSSNLGHKYTMLKNMCFHRILPRKDVEEFARGLAEHQLALLSDNTTVLDRAVTEHNLLSVSRMYNNIRLPELATLLGVTPEKAESVASHMIGEGRMKASIDQIDNLVVFETDEALKVWSSQVEGVCQSANDILEQVLAKHPQFAPPALS